MTAQRVSEQTHFGTGLHGGSRYYDAVGRPRKLAAGAMEAIKREYSRGAVTTRELAERYGVSVSLILTICYFTPKGAGKRPAPERMRPVVIPLSFGAIDEIEIGDEE